MTHLTVVVPTFDRAASLRAALHALLDQDAPPPHRVVVVDNNSRDDTRQVVAAMGRDVEYVFEPRQGLSFARNAGVEFARSRGASRDSLVAFTDDDVVVSRDWMQVLAREADGHDQVDCLGGRVLPIWPGTPPAWLTNEHWAPLALQDHGPSRRIFDRGTPLGLVGANLAFRLQALERLGGFSPAVQRVGDSIGSTEDHELLRRLYAAGGRALYAPDLVVHAVVQPERLTRAYHRRWHRGHGYFHAVMRSPETEGPAGRRVLGVPAHLYRTAAADGWSWLRRMASGDPAGAFACESGLWFFTGFFEARQAWLHRR